MMDYCKHGRDLGAVCVECTCLEQVEEMERELAEVQSAGVRAIAQARAHQRVQFGDYHDDGLTDEQLPLLAACYAIDADVFVPSLLERREATTVWVNLNPFPSEHTFPRPKKPRGKLSVEQNQTAMRITNLAKAGALIAAEIDRLTRRLKTT